MVRKVKKKRIEQNLRCSGKKKASEFNVSARNVQRILQNKLKLNPLKFQKAHDLTPQQKKVRVEQAKELLVGPKVVNCRICFFCDDAPFTIEQFVNKMTKFTCQRDLSKIYTFGRLPESKQHQW
ncbi:unnamed protein product [Hermetia illucens]|uniref:Transposase n=1 Tax=Hermetia illucens TaxID=343691 RepID=A0A7R8YYA4_HERIL|nr:unnamed protein product [Hermetia illucens]